MLITQTLVCFHTIRTYPGLSLEEVEKKMRDLFGDMDAVRFLTHGKDYWLLESRVHDLTCIECKDGRYYYNPEIKPYSRDPIIHACIEHALAMEKQSFNHRTA